MSINKIDNFYKAFEQTKTVIDQANIEKLEYSALCTNSEVNFVQGKVKIPLITLVANMNYPNLDIPKTIKEYNFNTIITLTEILEKSKDSKCCIAKITVDVPLDIGVSPIPFRINSEDKDAEFYEQLTIFPVGKFETTVCYHTLNLIKELQEKGINIKCNINQYIVYESEKYLNPEYAQYIASVGAHVLDLNRVTMYKYMMKAGFENVYYLGITDIKVNSKGLKILEKDIDTEGFKIANKLTVYDLGQFHFFNRASYKGYYLGSNFTRQLEGEHGEDDNIRIKLDK